MGIHGDKSQQERDWVLNEFKHGKSPILIATDVASRGLDVEDVKFVINYDYPNSSEDYIHRIGRTARSSKTGTAYTFFTPNNLKQVNDLISVLREANQTINPKLLQLVEDRGRFRGRGGMNDRRDRFSSGKRGWGDRENYNRGFGAKRDFGNKPQNGFGAQSYNGNSYMYGAAAAAAVYQHPGQNGAYQNGYDAATQQYAAAMQNSMAQQAYTYPTATATAAAPSMLGYAMAGAYPQ
ncbi:probable ATP-dependent RNA helicase DDX5 [Phyllobates terribilis]|uniref:probable ATP-dependent RNA helicase DDX5 n=1 Tax=Phyllobates terribilis TaxID=111132 RepID=UPI003CCA92F2